MNTIILLGFIILLILIEALTDSLTYKAWIKADNFVGGLAHITQIIFILVAILLGYWLNNIIILSLYNILLLLLIAGCAHLFFFDLFYNMFTNNFKEGNTSFWDRLIIKIGINKLGIFWIIIKGLLLFGSTILLSNIIS